VTLLKVLRLAAYVIVMQKRLMNCRSVSSPHNLGNRIDAAYFRKIAWVFPKELGTMIF